MSQDAKPPLPAAGGSYTRTPDGTLSESPAPTKTKPKTPRKSPAKPAEKEA